MATIRQRINRKNAAGTYDTIHLETSSDLVLRPDGTTLESTIVKVLEDLANKSGVTYSTTNPKAAGTASPGTATTVARSDHIHPLQTTITGNAASATKLATARTIDGVSFNGSAAIHHYGTCSTAAATAAKVVALTGFSLVTGAVVRVKFTVTNTAANPTLNVNSTGAKAIYYRGSAIAAGTLAANRTYEFVYNGTQYELVGDVDTDTNTTYTAATATPLVAGTAAVGTSAKYAREDHVHPAQTTITGNAGSATKLTTARTFQVNLASTATASFDGSANITPGVTGVLPVANGGTGASSLASLKTALDIGSPTVTAPTYPSSVPAVGSTMTWAGKTWRVVHKLTGVAIIALEYWETSCKYSASGSMTGYFGSNVWNKCVNFSNELNLFAATYIVPFGGNPCFVPGVDQVNGGFSHFATVANRIFVDSAGTAVEWWTASPNENGSGTSGNAYYVSTTGALTNSTTGANNVTKSYGFRPFVAIRL
ncbi:MAG: hypothetical protein NC489_28700 [Ruminococcus flavefaciens]|nr:hypothetical protein [Ruminococcus flavefaciens]